MRRQATGTHSGTVWWLAQRISALVMLASGTLLLAAFLRHFPFDHAGWQAAFQSVFVRLTVWLMVASLCLHAWIGLRDVLMDYVKPVAVRLLLNVLVMLVLLMCVAWATTIVWGVHG